jgi:hypothetical protein
LNRSGGVRAGIPDEEEWMTKIGLLTVVSTAALALALSFTTGAAAGPRPAMPSHPRVEKAIEGMRNAREHMQHAEGEFHGHREKTIEHLDAAIHEAEICLSEP